MRAIPKTTVKGTAAKMESEDATMKAALYMRVSKSDGSQTVENQRRDLLAYAERMGYEVVEFVDHETGSRNDRGGLRALLDACSRREVSRVLIWKLDRVTRMGAREALNFFHALDCWQIQYKSVTESWLDSEGPVPMLRDILISIVGSFAKQERENLIVRTKAGLARARAEGKVLGRPKKIFDRERLVQLRKAGWSLGRLSKEFRISRTHAARLVQSQLAETQD
jgi:DNA invertase Pin-like site-specific DNA recombinase